MKEGFLMKLTMDGIQDRASWNKAGITLPGYDVKAVSEKARKEPLWVHFGIGNIFRIFIGGIADGLLESGALDRGITCVETFDYDVVDKIYAPFDNLGLSVILHRDGRREYKVLGSMAEAIPPAGVLHHYRKGLCPPQGRWYLFPLCTGRYPERSGHARRRHGSAHCHALCPVSGRKIPSGTGIHGQLFPERCHSPAVCADDGRGMAESRFCG